MRRIIALLLLVALGSGCTKTTETTAQSGPVANGRHNASTIPHTLRIGDILDVTSLNPHLAAAASLNNMSELTMAYLVRYGHDNRPIPELATIVPSKANHLISSDGLTITWRLRRDVRWSDGVRFDADDVVFSTAVVNNPHNNEVGRDGWDLIAKVDEPDKFTVVYHLRRPYSAFLPTFFGSAGANPCVLPKHLLAKYADINNADYNSKPVGIGPFRYVKWVRGDHVEMEANPYYWRGIPKLKSIVYKFIPDRNTLLTQVATGEVDMWPLVGLGYYERVTKLTNVTTTHRPGFFYTHLDFNNAHDLFRDKPVREALRYAIDRAALRTKLQHGLGILQEAPLTPVSPFYTRLPQIPFDTTRARSLLDADGWKPGPDGIRVKHGQRLAFNFALQSGQQDIDQEVELMRATWQQIGAQISVQHYASTIMFAPFQQGGTMYAGKFDMILFSWQLTPDAGLANIFECNQIPPNGQNDLRYCNPKTDALLERMKGAYDEAERRPIVAAIQRQIVEDVPDIVMWIREDVYTYNRDLTGWHPNNTTVFDDMLGVDI